MRNERKLLHEIRMLRDRYGSHNIVAPASLEWVKLVGFPLPAHRYAIAAATILVKIPDGYDATSVDECFVDRDLALLDNRGREIPLRNLHKWDNGQYADDGYFWLCFHSQRGRTDLIGFVHTLRAYFTDPLKYMAAQREDD